MSGLFGLYRPSGRNKIPHQAFCLRCYMIAFPVSTVTTLSLFPRSSAPNLMPKDLSHVISYSSHRQSNSNARSKRRHDIVPLPPHPVPEMMVVSNALISQHGESESQNHQSQSGAGNLVGDRRASGNSDRGTRAPGA